MKNLFKNLKKQEGVSIVEMLIAFAVIITTISGALIIVGPSQTYGGGVNRVTFGTQSISIDTLTHQEASLKAQDILENARAASLDDYDAVVSDPNPIQDDIYRKQLIVDPFRATDCSKELKALVDWPVENGRSLSVELRTRVRSVSDIFDLGGDCATTPPGGGGNLTPTGTPMNLGGLKTNALDVLNRKAYIAVQDNVGFVIIDTTDVNNPICFGYSIGGCVDYANGFSAGAEGFDIDVAKASDGRTYAYLARNTTTNQLQVLDVTDMSKPVFVANKTLNLPPGGSFPQGYRVYYYKEKLYITTRETLGPELHVFDVSTPWDASSITEYVSPKELNRTVTDFVVVDQNIAGTDYIIAYLVAKAGLKEIAAWNVTDPTNMSEIASSIINLPGGYDALSVALNSVNKFLYVGRQSNNNEELFVYDASNPFTGLIEKAKKNVASTQPVGVVGIRVVGPFAYMVSDDSNYDLIVFDADPSNLNEILTSNENNSNKGTGIDYEDNIVYGLFLQGSATLKLFDTQ